MISGLDIGDYLFNFTVNQSMPGGSTWELVLDLGSPDFTCAYIQLWINWPGTQTYAAGNSAFIVATKDIDEAYSQASRRYITSFTYASNVYVNYNWRYLGYSYATDGKLSDSSYSDRGDYILIRSARIDGQNLRIVFENIHATITRNLELTGKVRGEKDVHV